MCILSEHRDLHILSHGTLLSHVYVSPLHILWHATLLFRIHIPPIYRDTDARNTVIHILLSSLHGFSAYHCSTCMYGFSILVIWIPVHITCIIVPCYPRIPVIWLFSVTDIVIPVTGHELLICNVWTSTAIVSCFPLSCFMLSTDAQVMVSYYMYHVPYWFLLYDN